MKSYARKLHYNFIYRFCLLVILPFALILVFLLFESGKNSTQNDRAVNEKLSSQIIYNLTQNFDLAENASKSILQNSMLLNFFDKTYQDRIDLNYYSSAVYEFVKTASGITKNFKMKIFLENESIPLGYGLFYHMRDIRAVETVNSFYSSNEAARLWIDGTDIEESANSYPKLNSTDSYCFMEKIMIGDRKIGLIFITLPKSTLSSVESFSADPREQTYQMYPMGKSLIYNFTQNVLSESELAALSKASPGQSGDRSHIYGVYEYQAYPFRLIVVTPPSSNNGMLQILIGIFVLFIAVMIFLFIRYSNKIIHDITYCLDAMNESITNNFESSLYVNRKDEISVIADRINYLLERIRKLVDINIKQKVAAKETQLIALQHQINPHFLYNTMEIFSSRMELVSLYKESAAMSAFCRILRYNINSETMLATIEEELLQVKNYIKIQDVRSVEVDFQTDIPKDILNVKIIKFVLQPFVENSFKFRQSGVPLIVNISAKREGNVISISIRDNGIGMTEQSVNEMNEQFVSNDNKLFKSDDEIGLFNINERLKLFYGEEYHITASLGARNDILCGAVFTICIKDEKIRDVFELPESSAP